MVLQSGRRRRRAGPSRPPSADPCPFPASASFAPPHPPLPASLVCASFCWACRPHVLADSESQCRDITRHRPQRRGDLGPSPGKFCEGGEAGRGWAGWGWGGPVSGGEAGVVGGGEAVIDTLDGDIRVGGDVLHAVQEVVRPLEDDEAPAAARGGGGGGGGGGISKLKAAGGEVRADGDTLPQPRPSLCLSPRG